MSRRNRLTPRDRVLVAAHVFEEELKQLGFPCLLVVSLPETNEIVTVSGGMTHGNVAGMIRTVNTYLEKLKAELPPPGKGGGR